MEKAVETDCLSHRATTNTRFGTADFHGWSKSIIDAIPFKSALDLCCGTGNQLVLYARRPEVENLVGVDVAVESLDVARKRVEQTGTKARLSLRASRMEDVFAQDPAVGNGIFDLASCFYGLYYAESPVKILRQMIAHVPVGGSVLVVGPHGPNNQSFFSLLQRHYPLPALALSSATTFMEQDVIPVLSVETKLEVHKFVNRIVYPDVDAVMEYWRSTTFFSESHEQAVRADIVRHVEKAGDFVVEKHIMACLGRRLR